MKLRTWEVKIVWMDSPDKWLEQGFEPFAIYGGNYAMRRRRWVWQKPASVSGKGFFKEAVEQ